MTNLNQPERSIRLDGSYNIRDAGGYATHDRRYVRWRKLLRSDSLHALTPASQQALRDHGLRTIIDLRRPSEAAAKPNVFATTHGLTYRNMPLFDDASAAMVDAPANTLEELYTRYIDMCQPQLQSILSAVIAASAAPVLVHCAVGKDRTGLVIALTLGALGIDGQTIADDYALSHALLRPFFELERSSIRSEQLDRYERMIQSPREAMEHVLGYLDRQYGGVGGYIAAIGITPEQVELLRANLLAPA